MRTIYRQQNSFDKRKSWTGFIIVFFVLIFVIFANLIQPQFMPNALYKIVSPVWKLERTFGDWLYSSSSYFQSKLRLQNENSALKSEIANLRNNFADSESIKKENDSLKNLLGRDTSSNAVLGVVLVSPPFSPYDILIIDIGSDHGVKIGNIVIAEGSIAIGDIAEVHDSYSKVSLFSSPGREIPVLVSDNKIETVARGSGSGALEIVLPREIVVQKGDSIRLPNLNNIQYGKVSNVVTHDVDFLQLVTFVSPVNIFELRYVSVMLDEINPVEMIKND